MRALLLLTAFSLLATTTLVFAAPADATAVCSDAVSHTCRALVCVPNMSGGQFCSRDLSPVCVREPCPGIP